MEENLLSIPPSYKLYKDRPIYIGTFLGGPLVAGYLMAENYRHLGQQDKAKAAWVISIISTFALFAVIFFVPGIENVPRYIIPIAYALIARYLVQKLQGSDIKKHIENGGQTYTVWRAVWIGFVGVIILLALLIGVLLIINKGEWPSLEP